MLLISGHQIHFCWPDTATRMEPQKPDASVPFDTYAEFREFTGTVGYRMKKEEVLTVRIDAEINRAIRAIAQEDERTVAWVARKLITEALEARGLLQSSDQERQYQ